MNEQILIIEDDVDTGTLLCEGLVRRGFAAAYVDSARACLDRMADLHIDLVITDVQMPEVSGIELITQLRERHPDVLSIVVTGLGTLDTAISAIRAGAYDFITKPVKIDVLEIAVTRALEHVRLKRELQRLRAAPLDESVTEGIAGTSPAIREMVEMIRRCAASDATVLITGESGTGKELVARALHGLSARATEPFIAINCAAMPPALLESELFGHVRGAFTDAKSSRQGLFVQAGRGTIFLDEIGEMPLETQVKLLRVLQERQLRPVGSDQEVSFDARVLTATNRELDIEVEERRFREDLYYRINVVAIAVPPLRSRPDDVLLLAHRFLHRCTQRIGKKVKSISAPAARLMMEFDWPGNVRELENCMERAVALCRLDEITVEDLPEKLFVHRKSLVIETGRPSELITLDEMERRYVRRVLDTLGENKTQAARVLGIDRRSVYRRLETTPVQPT